MYVVIVAILVKLVGTSISSAITKADEVGGTTTLNGAYVMDLSSSCSCCRSRSLSLRRSSVAVQPQLVPALKLLKGALQRARCTSRSRPNNCLRHHQKRIELVAECANESTRRNSRGNGSRRSGACAGGSRPCRHARAPRRAGRRFPCDGRIDLYALRLAGGQKFAADLRSITAPAVEPQYNYAVFLATACSYSMNRAVTSSSSGSRTRQSGTRPHTARSAPGLAMATTSSAARDATKKRADAHCDVLPRRSSRRNCLPGYTAVLPDLFGAINPERSP